MSEQALPYNASDPKQVRTAKRREDRAQQRREDGMRFVMGDVRGRNFVWYVLSLTGIYQSSFTGNSETFFREGKRDIGLQLIKLLEGKVPKEFVEMWSENLQQRDKDEKELEAAKVNGASE